MPDAAVPADDLERLLQHAGEAILVGGQALAFWIAYYRLPMKDAPGLVFTDVEFLGSKEDAVRFSEAVGYEVNVLRSLNGLSADAVRKRAKTITDDSLGARYRVMAPVDCLVSRLENLRTIAAKRTGIDIWQARMAVRVVRAQLQQLLKDGKEKDAIRAATEIIRAGTHPMGLGAFRKHGIDVLEAVPVDSFTARDFIGQQWTRSVSRIEQLRALARSPGRHSGKAI